MFSYFNYELLSMCAIYAVALISTLIMEFRLPRAKKCLYRKPVTGMTWWQFLHLSTRVVLGFAAPSYWYVMVGIDTSWELFERFYLGIHDWYDLAFNNVGLLLGVSFRYMIGN